VVEVLKTIFTILDKVALEVPVSTAAGIPECPMTMNQEEATSYQAARLLFDETTGFFTPPLGPPPLMPNSVISAALRISNDSEG
jgi:hypothetical protein